MQVTKENLSFVQIRNKERARVSGRKENILTYEGLRKYEDELHELKINKRQEVHRKLKKQENRVICPKCSI